MESFFLSETLKYLFLLFDEDNPLHAPGAEFVFTTQGHIVPLTASLRTQSFVSNTSFHPTCKRPNLEYW